MKGVKAYGMLLVAVLTAISAALTDSTISVQEWIVVVGTAVGAAGVYVVPNLAWGIGHYAKGVVSFLTAGLAVLYVVVPGGLTQAELIEVIIAGLAAIGIVIGKGERDYTFADKRRSGELTGSPHNMGGLT